jgi:hypothetical protein
MRVVHIANMLLETNAYKNQTIKRSVQRTRKAPNKMHANNITRLGDLYKKETGRKQILH